MCVKDKGADLARPAAAGVVVRGLLGSLRLRQWTKNLLVFAGLFFAGRLTDRTLWLPAALAFGAFCLLASAIYLLNDIRDREEDRLPEMPPAHCCWASTTARRPGGAGFEPGGFVFGLCRRSKVGYLGPATWP